MHVYICTEIYIYIYIYIELYACICMYINICIPIYAYKIEFSEESLKFHGIYGNDNKKDHKSLLCI
jgi:hypothetical protein